jgi:hypothetical protein
MGMVYEMVAGVWVIWWKIWVRIWWKLAVGERLGGVLNVVWYGWCVVLGLGIWIGVLSDLWVGW